MKFIKNHLMFILPLMAILLGIEFYLVFERGLFDAGCDKKAYGTFSVSNT